MKYLLLALILFPLVVFSQKNAELTYEYTIDFGDIFDPQYCVQLDLVKNDSLREIPDKSGQNDLTTFVAESNENTAKKKIPVYSPFDKGVSTPLDSAEFYHSQFKWAENDKWQMVDYSKTEYLRLLQEWYYNASEKRIEVVVNAYCPVFVQYDGTNFRGYAQRYWFKQFSPSTFSSPNKMLNDTSVLWAHRVQFQLPVQPAYKAPLNSFHNTRSETGAIKKVFDMELSQILFTQAQNQKLDIYYPHSNKKMSTEEFTKRTTLVDTLFEVNEMGEVTKLLPIVLLVGAEETGPMIVNQTFIFDRKKFAISSRINSIIITRKLCDEDGTPSGAVELFEVKF